jgi:hypothetical protein
MTISLLRGRLNVARAQYALSRVYLSVANKRKMPRGPALCACRHWRNEILTTAIQLRIALLRGKVCTLFIAK